MGCNQVCPYNTLTGCKVKEHNGICPLSNSVTTKPMTNADRIRAMSDEELAERDVEIVLNTMEQLGIKNTASKEEAIKHRLKRLQQPAEEVNKDA